MHNGKIVTFYSWKGGVGRSMALANIGVQLAQLGKDVLMVDWDLEAPGLDRYFISDEANKAGVKMSRAQDETGLIGLLGDLSTGVDAVAPKIWNERIRRISVPDHRSPPFGVAPMRPGRLHLLPSGDSAPNYSSAVANFSWNQFYSTGTGSERLELVRKKWAASYDFVLIDSRTGLTDNGGVCTVQMPDWLVLVFTGNEQSLSGGVRMIKGIQEARRDFAFDRMPLTIVPLLSRWDGEKEVDLAGHWLKQAAQEAEAFFASWLPKTLDPIRFFERVRIPHIARFSFGEPLPVVTHSLTDEALPGAAYARVSQILYSEFADAGRVVDPNYTPMPESQISDEHGSFTKLVNDEQALLQEVRAQERRLSSSELQLALYLIELGKALRQATRYIQAEPLLRRALTILEGMKPRLNERLEPALSILAGVLTDTKRFEEAELLYRKALEISESQYGPSDPRVAINLNNLAALLRRKASFADAEGLYRRALQINEEHYGKTHPEVATVLNNLGELLRDMGRLAESEALLRRAITVDENEYGLDHPRLALKMNNLAGVLREMGSYPESETLYRKALSIDEENYGPHHPRVAVKLSNLAGLLSDTLRLKEAEELYRRALEIDESNFGPNYSEVAIDLNNLGKLLVERCQFTEAEQHFLRAIAIDEEIYGSRHIEVAADLSNYALLLARTHRPDEAEAAYRRALEIDEATYGPDHIRVGAELNNLAVLLRDQERYDEAEEMVWRAIRIDEQAEGLISMRLTGKLANLATLFRLTGRTSEAVKTSGRAMEIAMQFLARSGHYHAKHESILDVYVESLKSSGADAQSIEAVKAEFGRADGTGIVQLR